MMKKIKLKISMKLSVLLSSIVTVESKARPCNTFVCVNLCCPEGQLYTISGTVEPGQICTQYDQQLYWSPYWETLEDNELSLVGREIFTCQEGTLVSTELLVDATDVQLLRSGELRISYQNMQTSLYNSRDFCLAFNNGPDHHNSGESELKEDNQETVRTTFSVCYKEEVEKVQVMTGIFNPIAIFISDFFILITIFVYFFLHGLRTNPFSKLTIGFLLNAFFCYLFVGIHCLFDLNKNRQISNGFCILLGYVIQHTFVGLFFWISAMAIHITRNLSNYFQEKNSLNPRKTLLLYTCYAQGCPFIITIMAAIMETCAYSYTLQDGGRFIWFSGSSHSFQTFPFYKTFEFLCFYLVITIIMTIIIIFLLIIGGYYLSYSWQMRGMAQRSINQTFKSQLLIICQLFLIMSIPWCWEMISYVLNQEYTDEKSSLAWRLVPNILNLLVGFLIFLSLVCKRTVVTGLQTQLGEYREYKPGTQGASFNASSKNNTRQGRVWAFRD